MVCYGQRLCGRGRALYLSARGSAWYQGRCAPAFGIPVVLRWGWSVLSCPFRQLVRDLLVQLDRGLDSYHTNCSNLNNNSAC
jgi:hypothetical protein